MEKCYSVRFRGLKGNIVTSLSRFDTKEQARDAINRLKKVERKVRGKISPQVKSARVIEVCEK